MELDFFLFRSHPLFPTPWFLKGSLWLKENGEELLFYLLQAFFQLIHLLCSPTEECVTYVSWGSLLKNVYYLK